MIAVEQQCQRNRAYLQVVPEELVIQLRDLELICLLPVHDPGAALTLRVHQNRISSSPGHHDTVLNTQVICWQTLQAAKTPCVQDASCLHG